MSNSSDSKLELTLKFNDGQSILLSDKNAAKHANVLVTAISMENPSWLTSETIVSTPLDVPFPSSAGKFLLENIAKYKSSAVLNRKPTLTDYPEADQCSLEELRDVIELANFLECLDFVQCIGFVIAQKLMGLPVDQIVAYMGFPLGRTEDLTNDEMGWPLDPVDYEEERRRRQREEQ